MFKMRNKLRLFITGGTGFFGKSMLDYRLRHPEWEWAKAEWVILSRSPEKFKSNFKKLTEQPGISFMAGDVRDFAFPGGRFDAIVHAATSAVNTLPDDEMTSVIVGGSRHVVDFAKTVGCNILLFTSSGAVYGARRSPTKEDDECNPATAYGKGKLIAERMLVDAGLDVKIARCFAFVGRYLDRNIHYAIGNFIRDSVNGCPIMINGDGTPQRSYLYADDLVEWLFKILACGESGRPYNVGSDKAISIRELAELVRSVVGNNNEIVVKESPTDSRPSVYVPDVSRARIELSLDMHFELKDAIARMVCETGD